VNDAKLLIVPHRPASTGNLYTRLHEFPEMGFVLHALRAGDTFVDVGANIGAYSILAASIAGVTCIAFEPSSETYSLLTENVRVNGYESRVDPVRSAVGANDGEVSLTSELDTVNHIAADVDGNIRSETVRLTTLDGALDGKLPAVIKIDVEGYELPVLEGAKKTLKSQQFRALIIEMNGSGARYGLDEDRIDTLLRQQGLEPVSYDPFSRRLIEIDPSQTSGNRIYIRERSEMQQRLASAEPFRLPGGWQI
jgi:FkbM family methyltransferase